MSSTSQENDPKGHQISIPVPITSDDEGHTKTHIKDKHENLHEWFKKFDAKKRNTIIICCELVAFLLAGGTCVASFTIPALQKSRPRGIVMWQWSLLASVLLVGPLLSKAIVPLVLLFKDRKFSAKENILYYVAGLVESAWVVLWFSMILIAWLIVVDEPDYLGLPPDKSEKIIKKFDTTYPIISVTLVTFILGSFLWLLKDLLLMRTKSSFHIRRFFDRIYEALVHQSIVEILSPPPPPPKNDGNHLESDKNKKKLGRRIISFGGWKKKVTIDVSCFADVTQENVSCWGMKKVIQWITEKENQYLTYYKDNEPIQIKTDDKAVQAAKDIYKDQKVLNTRPDIEEKLGKNPDLKAKLLEGADGDEITEPILIKWMVKAFEYRKSLVNALEANKKQFQTFTILIDVLLIFFIFALWLIMLRVETRKVIFVIASAIVGSAFIFGDTCKKIFENFMFVFMVHPFDIGDCCDFGDTRVVIREIGVLSTTVLTHDNVIKHYSNSKLAADENITNYTRSARMGDFIEFPLKASLSTKYIMMFKERLFERLEKEKSDSSQYWYTAHDLELEYQDANTMKMRLHFQHKFNHQDFEERQNKKFKLLTEIKDIIEDLESIANKESSKTDNSEKSHEISKEN